MALPAYPDGLPPARAKPVLTPRARNAASSLPGPPRARNRARAFDGARYTIAYVFKTADMATWLAWYEDTLIHGQLWHTQQLPGYHGIELRACRFIGPVSREHVGRGIWRLAGTLEVRSLGEGEGVAGGEQIFPPDGTEIEGIELTARMTAEAEVSPYLWIGARVSRDDENFYYDNYELSVVVYEPQTPEEPAGIVASYPMFTNMSAYDPPVPDLSDVIPEESKPVWLASTNQDTRDIDESFGFANPLLQVTKNGMYQVCGDQQYDLAFAVIESEGLSPIGDGQFYGGINAPFDPLGDPDANPEDGYRDVHGAEGQHLPCWSIVTVLDPDTGTQPADTRDLLQVPELLAGAGITPTVLPGQYIIKVANVGPCRLNVPMLFDLEVHVNKAPFTLKTRITKTIGTGAKYPRTNTPWGNMPDLDHKWSTACPFEVGLNPHWRNWWQGAVLVDVVNGTIEVVEDEYIPPAGFLTDSWLEGRENCGASRIAVYVGAVLPTSSPWADTLEDAFALSVVNATSDPSDPWQVPQTLPGSSGDPVMTQAIFVKGKAVEAGITMGNAYSWGNAELVGPTPEGEFELVPGVTPDPTNTTWGEPLADAGFALGYRYVIVILVGLQATLFVNPAEDDGCPP